MGAAEGSCPMAPPGRTPRSHNRAVQPTSVPDSDKRRGLRRMKAVAGGFLLVATVVYLLTRWQEAAGAGALHSYVLAAAEASMVGDLADWFGVTSLFTR